MLYKLAHILKERLPFIWTFIEKVNEWLFLLRYGRKIKHSFSISPIADYDIKELRDIPTERMVEFFEHQPAEAYTYFRPHPFDAKTIKKLQSSRSYLAYVLLDKENGCIAGYCFNRCFFMGKGFRGRMVDIDYRGKGLGTAMNKVLDEVGFGIGLRLFESVSKDNIASYRSALSASKVRVVEELPHNELYLEILPE